MSRAGHRLPARNRGKKPDAPFLIGDGVVIEPVPAERPQSRQRGLNALPLATKLFVELALSELAICYRFRSWSFQNGMALLTFLEMVKQVSQKKENPADKPGNSEEHEADQEQGRDQA